MLLVSNSGGVLLDLLALEPWWSRHESIWVLEPAPDTSSALSRDRPTHWMESPNRRPFAFAASMLKAYRILRTERPDVVVSAGSSLAVPFFLIARVRRTPTFWVWSLNLLRTPGTSGRICSRLASVVLLQHETMRSAGANGVLVGELY